jgi:hypothetical protein
VGWNTDLIEVILSRRFLVESENIEANRSMFSRVVYKIADDKYKVEGTDEIGNKSKTTYYKSVDDMPDDIRDKVKQLMWTSKDDQSITEDLGVRIGENIFWII